MDNGRRRSAAGCDDNPWDDPLIHRPYNADSVEEKVFNKLWFQEMHGLPVDEDAPLLCCIAPSAPGLRLAAEVLPEFLEQGCSLILDEVHSSPLSCRFPKQVTCCSAAAEIFSAADLFLALPGSDWIALAMRYGTVPAALGRDDLPFGSAFWTAEALRGTIARALQVYRDPLRWESLERRCME